MHLVENRLRRLMEYSKWVNRTAAIQRCKKHQAPIGLLLSDQREAAADFMRLYLRARSPLASVPKWIVK